MLALVFDMLHQQLPCGSDVGVEGVGIDAVDGGATVTLWLLQLWPVQHSMLQSSKVQFWGCALKAALNVAQAAALSGRKDKK